MHAGLKFYPFFLLILAIISCTRNDTKTNIETSIPAQQATVNKTLRTFTGQPCEGCNLMFLGMPLQLDAVDTSAGWNEGGQRLIISGTIFQYDEKTPAPDVILYYYHTDRNGRYTPVEGMLPSARKHGHLRGWIKTGADGKYAIYTSRPAQYPDEKIEAHIHVFIKEPYVDVPYPIDEWIFDDDPLVTKEIRNKIKNQGGDPILNISTINDVQLANHDIILGQDIPGYPKSSG